MISASARARMDREPCRWSAALTAAAALVLAPLALASLPASGAPAGPAAAAAGGTPQAVIPSAWPAPSASERRWWIPLPSEPSLSPDTDLSPDPRQWRLELVVGRIVDVDCNLHQFTGQIRTETVPPQERTIHRVELGPMISTRMACPDRRRQRRFVALQGRPHVLPYDASRPLVVYAPRDALVRWRIWRPERSLQPARPF
jgi:ecotin